MEFKSFKIKSKKPKYKQIVAFIEEAISIGDLKKDDKLPSLNEIKNRYGLSRDTVLTAFNELKNRGIIKSIAGKGYYVFSEDTKTSQKVFLLFDELNSFKEDLYNSFLAQLDENVQVDIFFHHFNPIIFEKLIAENVGNYSSYVIMPANLKNVSPILETLPENKVFILDQLKPALNKYAAVYQNFEDTIFNGLLEANNLIKNYAKMVLIFNEKIQPIEMLFGFEKFCKKENMLFEVVSNIENREVGKGEIYLIPEDKNLIRIIKKMNEVGLNLKEDVGIISINDTMLKEVVKNGITTISTDFKKMGENLATLISRKEFSQIENPSKLIIRNSL